MAKRCVLTGVGGSIAVHFLQHLLEETNWEIIGIDSFRHKGWTDRTRAILSQNEEWQKRTTIITHDLTAPFSPLLTRKIGHVDYLISMASLSDVEASIQNPVPFIENNIDLTLSLLEYAREVKPEVFVQISTDEVYGAIETKDSPKMEEWAKILPSNPYAASKAAQEAIAIAYWRTYDVPVVITNTMNNFGEYQQPSKFPAMVQRLIEKGEVVKIHGERDGQIGSRSYIHSKNFADAVLFILTHTKPHLHEPLKADMPDRYNIAGDKQLTNLELAQLIASLMGKELKYEIVDSHTARPGHDPHYGLDSSKLYSMGWIPPMTFEESMKRVIDWQSKNDDWMKV
jgi:dTDP-glucose 4,6-dehydratase